MDAIPSPANIDTKQTPPANATEQRMLKTSFYGVLCIAAGSLAYGIYLKSDVVILNGIFSLFSLGGSGLNLLASKLVVRPADKRFQFGYWHVEPMVHCTNALMMCIICIYSLINGIEGMRHGGNVVNAMGVIGFSIVTGIICGTIGIYEWALSKKLDSQLLRNDAREWLMDFGFSLITLAGFLGLFILPEPARAYWAYYADSAMVAVMALVLLPFPVMVLRDNLREVLRITSHDDPVSKAVNSLMLKVKNEFSLSHYTNHVLKVGRTYFVEVNIIVDEKCKFKTVAQQDALREQIYEACELPLKELWISVCVTENPKWS